MFEIFKLRVLNLFRVSCSEFRVWIADVVPLGFIALPFSCMVAICAGEEPAALRQDFENRLPGLTPEGWGKAWGGQLLDDIFTTSNTEALSGKQSLLLERRPYAKPIQYGLARLTPPINATAAKLVIPFLLKGPTAYGASFSIELRLPKTNVGVAWIVVAGGKAVIRKVKKPADLGGIEFGVWHRFVVILPLEADKGKSGSAILERRQKDGSWTPCGDSADVDVLFSIMPGRKLEIQLIPGVTGEFQLFIDDLSVEPASVL